jgi:hypothetical protein
MGCVRNPDRAKRVARLFNSRPLPADNALARGRPVSEVKRDQVGLWRARQSRTRLSLDGRVTYNAIASPRGRSGFDRAS